MHIDYPETTVRRYVYLMYIYVYNKNAPFKNVLQITIACLVGLTSFGAAKLSDNEVAEG